MHTPRPCSAKATAPAVDATSAAPALATPASPTAGTPGPGPGPGRSGPTGRRGAIAAVVVTALVAGAAACSDPVAEGDAPTYAGRDAGKGDLPSVHLDPMFPKITFRRPVFVTHAGDGTNRLFVVEQAGRIRVVENDNTATSAGVLALAWAVAEKLLVPMLITT